MALISAINVTDSRSNVYTRIPQFSLDAGPGYPFNPLPNASHIEAFWCPSSIGTLTSITTTFSEAITHKFLILYRFRGHDNGNLINPISKGSADLATFASDKCEFGTPLPTWTFTRNDSRVYVAAIAAVDRNTASTGGSTEAFGELDAAFSFRYGTSGSGPDYTEQRTAITAFQTSLLASGTTAGIEPGHYNVVNASLPSLVPNYNLWKVTMAFGLNAGSGTSCSSLVASNSIHAQEFSSSNITAVINSGTVLSTVAAGDGLLLIATNPGYLITNDVNLSGIKYRTHAINDFD